MIKVYLTDGLGNQFFQYAIAYSYAQKVDAPLMLDASSFYDKNKGIRDFQLDKFNISTAVITKKSLFHKLYKTFPKFENMLFRLFHVVVERGDCRKFSPQYYPVETYSKDIYFKGYFQNTAYFDFVREDLVRQLVPTKIENPLLYEEIKSKCSVGIHVRRGDFVQLGWAIAPEYYKKAVEYMLLQNPNSHFYVFSDDKDYVSELFADINCTIVGKDTVYTSDVEEWFQLRSCCHQIIQDSTFGWWAAYLNDNPNKIVITPTSATSELYQKISTIQL